MENIEKNLYIAHTAHDGQRMQTVSDHLLAVGRLCGGFASAFSVGLDAVKLARTAGLLHDIGKYSDDFQRRIRGENIRVDHSTAGALECFERRLLAPSLAVAGHHGGLPDCDNSPGGLLTRLNRAKEGKIPPCDRWREEIELPDGLTGDTVLKDKYDMTFFIRMIYSCLVDADWLDTEAFALGDQSLRGGYDSIFQLHHRLFEYVAEKGWDKPKAPIDKARYDIFNTCAQKGREGDKGLYSLTVPTGGGKTTASLAFALEHAKKHGLKRVFYIIPYTSIIEQNAKVFRDILGENNVLEHHSGVTYKVNDGGENDRLEEIMAHSTENWDMPVVVTTAVQFFNSLYASHGPECRKLHNLSDSVIIFDEAQMIPFDRLLPCVAAISALVKHYGVTAVLCTATQPSLGTLFERFLLTVNIQEICPDGTYDKRVFDRVTYRDIGEVGSKDIADKISACHQALCVVNTRKAAREIYSAFEGDGNYHLSTLMYPNHRRAVIDEIKDRLKKGMACRVVSTSLIEAGVDISFPTVFRELNGIDSIVQAAGRCNRSGKNDTESSVVSIFRMEGQNPKMLSANIASAEKVLSQFDRLDSKEAISCYFEELAGIKGEGAMDGQNVVSYIQKAQYPMLKTVSERFSLIDDNTKTVYVPSPDSEELLSRLRGGERSTELFRRLASFGISLYDAQYDELYLGGHIEKVDGIDAAILINRDKYSAETGLDTEAGLGSAEII